MLGRVTTLITKIQHHHLQARQQKSTGDSWTASLIVQLWTINRNMWEHRNQVKHSTEHPDHLSAMDDIMSEVLAQADMGYDSLLPADRRLYPHNLDKFRGQTKAQLLQWLASMQLAREAYKREQGQQILQLQQQQTHMRSWLSTAATITTAQRETIENLHLVTDDDDSSINSDASYRTADGSSDSSDNSSDTANTEKSSTLRAQLLQEIQMLKVDEQLFNPTTLHNRTTPKKPKEQQPLASDCKADTYSSADEDSDDTNTINEETSEDYEGSNCESSYREESSASQ